jgi:hypothetical protein
MRAAAMMKVACANYLHVLGLVALIPSHNLQPLAKDDLIEMEFLQSPERVQLDPICVVPSPITVKVCIDLWHHGETRWDLAEQYCY